MIDEVEALTFAESLFFGNLVQNTCPLPPFSFSFHICTLQVMRTLEQAQAVVHFRGHTIIQQVSSNEYLNT